MTAGTRDVTKLLRAVSACEAEAWEQLLALIYGELRLLAGRQMQKERRGHTLSRTALVNEAYLRLLGERDVHWESRAHFFAAAAEAMRRILVDHARQRRAEKRGGQAAKVSLDAAPQLFPVESPRGTAAHDELQMLDAALAKLESDERHREKCHVVKLRYFVGLSLEEIAQALGKSVASVKRDWSFARAWLYREMTKDRKAVP